MLELTESKPAHTPHASLPLLVVNAEELARPQNCRRAHGLVIKHYVIVILHQ